MKKYILIIFGLTGLNINLNAQSTAASNGYVAGNFLGFNTTNTTNPLLIKTNDITRMRFNGFANGYGVNTSGFVGMGTVVSGLF